MNTHLAPEEELEHLDEDDEPEARFSAISLRDGGTDLFRGVLVALIALAVGAVVLTQGFGDDGVDSATDDTSITAGELTAADPDGTLTDDETAADDPAAPDADSTDDEAATTDGSATDDAMTETTMTDGAAADSDSTASNDATTTSALVDTARPPGEVDVVVLNATDQKGIAGQGTEMVQDAGYAVVPAGNATNPIGSVIYYLEGYRADAIAVSQIFSDGLDGLVQPYDPSAPPAATEDIGDAKVIVVLGVDGAISIG